MRALNTLSFRKVCSCLWNGFAIKRSDSSKTQAPLHLAHCWISISQIMVQSQVHLSCWWMTSSRSPPSSPILQNVTAYKVDFWTRCQSIFSINNHPLAAVCWWCTCTCTMGKSSLQYHNFACLFFACLLWQYSHITLMLVSAPVTNKSKVQFQVSR